MKDDDGFDPYRMLRISHSASIEVIRAAYQALSQEYHPDRGGMGDAEYTRLLNRAKDILFDPKKKADFDAVYRAKVRASRPRPW